jgi:hypothetical protein
MGGSLVKASLGTSLSSRHRMPNYQQIYQHFFWLLTNGHEQSWTTIERKHWSRNGFFDGCEQW